MPLPRVRFSVRRLMVVIAAAAFVLAAVAGLEEWGIIGPSEEGIHAMGDDLISEIEAWRSEHGRYPGSLSEAGLASPTRYKGGFEYSADQDSFSLSIGVADGENRRHVYSSDGSATLLSIPGWWCFD